MDGNFTKFRFPKCSKEVSIGNKDVERQKPGKMSSHCAPDMPTGREIEMLRVYVKLLPVRILVIALGAEDRVAQDPV